jgi:hypothetical protein
MERYFCAAHLRRAGIEVPATAVIEGEAMCADCFKGKAIRPEEEYLGLMNFLPRLDRRKKIRAVLRKNSMDDIDPSFECSAFCSLHPVFHSSEPRREVASSSTQSSSV